jgi:hypothetical protein
MSDINIDALSAAELKSQLDALEVDYNPKANSETLRKKLKEALGEDDTGNADNAPLEGELQSKFIEIMFQKDKDDKQPVYIGVNGKSFRFQRGVFVKCPRYLLPTIENMKKDVLDEDTMETITIQPYAYQVREVR